MAQASRESAIAHVSNLIVYSSYQRPATSDQRPATSDQRPATSDQHQTMDNGNRGKKNVAKWISGSIEGDKGGAAGERSRVGGIQNAKNIIYTVIGGVFRLKGGSEALPTTPCEPTSPNQPNVNMQNPKPEAPPGYEIEGSEAAHSGVMPKTEDKVLSELTSTEGTGKCGIREGLLMTAEERKKVIAMRDIEDLHQVIVPLREAKKVQIDDETFLEKLYFFHGFLPQMECRVFLRRAGDFLIRKWEDEGKDYIVVSVGVLLEYTRDVSDDMDQNYGADEPVFIKDYVVKRNKKGLFIDYEINFDSLENLLVYYLFHPHKESLEIQLERPCPKRYFEFSAAQIEKKKTLGSGAFGEVFLGEVNAIGIKDMPVAVKSLLKDAPNSNELSERMLEEARIMLTLNHEHVLEIYGWAIDKKPFMLLMELMEGGSLDNFLINHFDGSNDTRLVKFALEAAKGIAYLHEMNVLHRDVAARNCLLTADLTLKVADLGLATTGTWYYMKSAEKLPTRYLSPETLSMFVFVQASDCFALGNLVYEIFSGGLMPFEDFNSADAREKILTGETNSFDETRAPPALRSFVEKNLWTYMMRDRKDMQTTVEYLKGIYKACKKVEGGPKTLTQETEMSIAKEEGEPVNKEVTVKIRRRKPVSRAEIMEDICPTQEETAANKD
ncbi:unnamed protein product [Caenorhabditis auriculariae]|uniref:non-specific protein-tyrosine kinase n=1 Tax=Caenorhabditis auriculariae TaxID=2777116 RepID=A0A8S1HKK8_9PELO|nr:unnamed protein product [Caenorhabditis auriculariae]